MLRKLLAVAAGATGCAAAGLLDKPLIGDAIQYLDGDAWSVGNGTVTVGAIVPGDIITDFQRAGLYGDPLLERNFKNAIYDSSLWTYSRTFDVDASVSASGGAVYLVFDGIKMASSIELNGVALGDTADQFLRYRYDVTSSLKPTGNVLTVTFYPTHDDRNVEGRYMACSGKWDWAFYSSTTNPSGSATFSKGIWKSVYLVPVSTTAIQHVVPLVYYTGGYPTAPLTDATAGPWTVVVTTYFVSSGAVSGTLTVNSEFGGAGQSISLPAGNSSFSMNITVSAGAVKLWWPNSMGAQQLYNVSSTFKPSSPSSPVISSSRWIGFRVLRLVTDDDSNPAALSGVDGSGNLTMRFKVNGADAWMRGGDGCGSSSTNLSTYLVFPVLILLASFHTNGAFPTPLLTLFLL